MGLLPSTLSISTIMEAPTLRQLVRGRYSLVPFKIPRKWGYIG